MTPCRAPEPPLTEEQLRLAFRELWRPGRPNTVDAMLASPVYGPVLRCMARNRSRQGVFRSTKLARAPAPGTVPPPALTPSNPLPWRRAGGTVPQHAPAVDHKRAAANDRDD